MQQAYQNFNAGKYKQALNSLTTNPSNIDSYQPNLYICEYMSNRCQQSAINCLKKLNQIIFRKYKRQLNRNDPQTEYIIKLNIAVLLILQGRRDSALIILKEIYLHRHCFIEYMQTRIFLLLLELNVLLKNPFEVFELHRFYLLKPVQSKVQNNQWISVILHEHGKTFVVVREQFNFMINVYLNQALINLGAHPSTLTNIQDDQKLKEDLISKIRKRKNVINKYYEINLIMISRFLEAQKELHCKNYQRCLSLMNFINIVEEYEQMPATKIITNILNSFATSNTGIVHFIYEKPTIALLYFSRAKALLSKACTGVEDKDLHLFSLNYGNYIESITYNQALCLLGSKSKQAYQYFDSLRKSNQMSKSYKFWYRNAQSILQYYHESKVSQEQKKILMNAALNSLTNCMMCIDKTQVPQIDKIKNITRGTLLVEDQIEPIIMRLNNEVNQFKSSVYALLCYVSLGLELYRRVITIGLKALQQKKIDSKSKVNILYYIIEAQIHLGKTNYDVKPYFDLIQQEVQLVMAAPVQIIYTNNRQQTFDRVDYETIYYFQLFNMYVGEQNITEAMKYCQLVRRKLPTNLNNYMCDAINYLHLHLQFDRKFIYPYQKRS